MKNQNTSLNQSTILDVSVDQIDSTNQKQDVDSWQDHIFRGIALKCLNGNKGYGYCVDCTESSLLCSDQTCDCYQPHIKFDCQNIKRISIFNKKIQSKIKDSTQILDKISNLNQEMIDKLSEFQEQIRTKFQRYGLNKSDSQIAHKIINYSQKQELICSKDFIQYAKDYQDSQKKWFFDETKFYLDLVSKVRSQILTKIQAIQNLIYYEHMDEAKNKSEVLFSNSSIIKIDSPEKKQLIEICKDFGPIKRAIKIYSTQKYKFTCKQVLQKCQNHSNLLFVGIGQNNRIFGGFSGVNFCQKANHVYADTEMKSFIFDLTNKYKSKQVYKQNTVTLLDSNESNKHGHLLRFGNSSHPNLIFSENSIQNNKINYIDFESRYLSTPIFEKKSNPRLKVKSSNYYRDYYDEYDYDQQLKLNIFEVFQLIL